MNTLLLLSSFIAFAAAVLGLWRPLSPWIQRIYTWIPAFALAIGVYSIAKSELGVTEYPDLLLGARIGLDELGRAFLILISTVWLIAGLYSRRYFANREQARFFRFYFLATYSGTIGLAMAQDAPTFYAGYAAMTLGGYGLITHTRTTASLVAGRVYMVVALFGEMMALAGLIIAAATSESYAIQDMAKAVHDSPHSGWAFWLIFIGFGTKVGLVPLHFWLPRSYYWAPIPAVAVLSGAMTKAGVLGWLRFLPDPGSSAASTVIIGAGALMAFYGVIAGLTQTRAKTTLAFSSLSQMGYLTMAFATMLEPGAKAGASLVALLAFAFHHGLTKVALFLGLGLLAKYEIGSRARTFILASLVFCAAALVGFPFTAGAYAKSLLKYAGAEDGVWHSVSGSLLTLGSIGTLVLMTRFLVLCFRGEHDQVLPAKGWGPWGTIFAMVLTGAGSLPWLISVLGYETQPALSVADNIEPFVPIAFGSALALVLTHRIWLKHSHMTPRPFDTILQSGYKAVWEDFPREVNEAVTVVSHDIARLDLGRRIKAKGRLATDFAASLHMTWYSGCALFLTIGILIWALLAAGGAL